MSHSERVRRMVRAVAILFTLACCAVLCASAAVRLVSHALLPPSATTHAFARAGDAASGRAFGEAVLRRNIFDARTGALTWDEDATASGPRLVALPAQDESLPACEGSARLVAAMVMVQRPELSFVSITDQGQTLLYQSGMQINGRELVGIREQRAFLRGSSATTCQLTMFSPPATLREAPRRPSADKGDQRIVRRSPGKYVIARALIEEALSGSGITTFARVLPQPEGGLKLSGIRRDSVLEQLGLRNGDVLRSIDGRDISSPDVALEAYARLRTLNRVSITLRRAGNVETMVYDIE